MPELSVRILAWLVLDPGFHPSINNQTNKPQTKTKSHCHHQQNIKLSHTPKYCINQHGCDPGACSQTTVDSGTVQKQEGESPIVLG